DALVLLSLRSNASVWFDSASETINQLMSWRPLEKTRAWHAMNYDLLRTTFTPVPFKRAAAEKAYDLHNAAVRATVPAHRLLEWQVTDGWDPICERLGVPVPHVPFPHLNSTEDFTAYFERFDREQLSLLQRARLRLRR
ncbi:MAG: sulfotransferase family protein, partial [Actinomycetota bacterium]